MTHFNFICCEFLLDSCLSFDFGLLETVILGMYSNLLFSMREIFKISYYHKQFQAFKRDLRHWVNKVSGIKNIKWMHWRNTHKQWFACKNRLLRTKKQTKQVKATIYTVIFIAKLFVTWQWAVSHHWEK